jgi:hypothetical protein
MILADGQNTDGSQWEKQNRIDRRAECETRMEPCRIETKKPEKKKDRVKTSGKMSPTQALRNNQACARAQI